MYPGAVERPLNRAYMLVCGGCDGEERLAGCSICGFRSPTASSLSSLREVKGQVEVRSEVRWWWTIYGRLANGQDGAGQKSAAVLVDGGRKKEMFCYPWNGSWGEFLINPRSA